MRRGGRAGHSNGRSDKQANCDNKLEEWCKMSHSSCTVFKNSVSECLKRYTMLYIHDVIDPRFGVCLSEVMWGLNQSGISQGGIIMLASRIS